MGDTRYLLVDFDFDEDADAIVSGVEQLLNTGYKPILAHAERYVNFHRDMREVEKLSRNGVLIQLDTQSVTGDFGFRCKRRTFKILKLGLADIVSSDAHGLNSRPPGLSKAYDIISRKFGEEYADDLCCHNARHYFGVKH